MASDSAQQLKDAIDRGEAGDKVAFPDPAAAPLGTDEEAAGTPIPRRAAAQAYHQEVTAKALAARPKRSIAALLSVAGILIVITAILIWGSTPH